jgi:type I restriction enzyme S subunit
MDLKPGYKQTEVGVIPEDWEVKAIYEFAAIKTGPFGTLLKASEYSEGEGVPLISVGEIREGFLRITEDTPRVSEAVTRRLPQYVLKMGDIVFGRKGGVERSALIRQPQHGWFLGSDSISIRPSRYCHDEYLALQFQSARVQGWLIQHAIGTTMASLNQAILRNVVIPLPIIKAEQEAIAEALGDADALIESLEQLIAKKRQVKQGTMQELLTGKKRLAGFKGKWKINPLRKFVRQFIVPMRDKPKRLTGDIPWCRIEDFDGMYLTDSKSGQGVDTETVRAMNLKVYPPGTLLVSCSADLGQCAIVGRPLVSNQTFIGLEMDKVVSSNLFFYYLMTSKAEELNNLSSGTTISYLSREQFEEFAVFVPFDRQEQTAIAEILNDIDAEIAALEAKLDKARQLKQGMMQELLTGRIRLL